MSMLRKFFDTTGKPDGIEIAIWGPPQSGKTNYLAMLLLSQPPEGWSITAETKTMQFLEAGIKRIVDEKEFIDATVADKGSFYPIDFEISGGLRSKIYTVSLPEYPGEYYTNPQKYPEFTEKIAKSNGIIWLIDPIEIDNPTEDEERKSYTRMIAQWLGILKEYGGGHIQSPMAFCLSKMDDPKHKIGFKNPKSYCLNKLGRPVQILLENFCDPEKVEFFATSTAGFLSGTDISNVDPNNPRKFVNEPNPIGLFEPFVWLFDEI